MIPVLGIVNANTRSVQDVYVPVPNMRTTLNNWFQALALGKVIKQQVDHDIKESVLPIATLGMIQTLSDQQLALKPEGQRAWIWQTLHATTDLILIPDDIVIIKGLRYRVMTKDDNTQYGYVQYHLVQDYVKEPYGAN